MNKTMQTCVTLALVVLATLYFCDALDCHSCMLCNETPVNKTKSKTCKEGDNNSCYTANVETLGRNFTWRGCSDKNISTCEKKEFNGYKMVEVCYCKGEMCNDKSFSTSSTFAVSAAALVMIGLVTAWAM